jgi:hypothetical protein
MEVNMFKALRQRKLLIASLSEENSAIEEGVKLLKEMHELMARWMVNMGEERANKLDFAVLDLEGKLRDEGADLSSVVPWPILRERLGIPYFRR